MKSKTMIKTGQMKRKPHAKKLRSKLPRRRRSLFSPILCRSRRSIDYGNANNIDSSFRQFPVDSSWSSEFPGESSCNSSGFSAVSHGLKIRPPKKRVLDEIGGSTAVIRENDQFLRVARKYCREEEIERIRGVGDVGVEASESCVESSSGAEVRNFLDQSLKVKSSAAGNTAETVKETRVIEESDAISRSEISCVEQLYSANDEISREISGELLQSGFEIARKTENSMKNEEIEEVVSFTSQFEFPSQPKFQSASSSIFKLISDDRDTGDGKSREVEISETSQNCVASTSTVSKSGSNAEQKPTCSGCDSDLLCTEQFSLDNFSDHTSSLETTFPGIFQENSEANFSDYSPSVWLGSLDPSESDFSERSPNSTPSPTFTLFLQYSEQFSKLSSPLPSVPSSRDEGEDQTEFALLRFKDDDDEESYQRLRNRERRGDSVQNYAEHYRLSTEYGNLVLQQRLQMVHWIVEQSATKELQSETMFLGVNLLDRFLSKGFFKSMKSLQIAGIACLALATRIEENQPRNTVREKTFSVGSNVYRKCEVVAMEWMVQKVLNFQCFLPTIYNFLWFYLKAAKANAEVEKRAGYLALLALLDNEQICYWPSSVAAGLVILASLAANQDKSCQLVMETHVRTKDDDLPECIKSLEWLVKYVC